MCVNPILIKQKDKEFYVKCGKCAICRKQKAQEWAIKLIKELEYHKEACMVTLTFDTKILLDKKSKAFKYGANASFLWNLEYSKEYFRKFIKRLRKKIYPQTITYFRVGEYGEKTKRPHYHIIIFGKNFKEDRIKIQNSKSGYPQYFSRTIQECWAAGIHTLQDCNANNIAYVAQYTLKKFKKKDDPYKEKIAFSNRSKISAKWIRRNPEAILQKGLKTEDNKTFPIPKAYVKEVKKLAEENKKDENILENYENKLEEYFNVFSFKEQQTRNKIKAEIIEKRNKNTIRDF